MKNNITWKVTVSAILILLGLQGYWCTLNYLNKYDVIKNKLQENLDYLAANFRDPNGVNKYLLFHLNSVDAKSVHEFDSLREFVAKRFVEGVSLLQFESWELDGILKYSGYDGNAMFDSLNNQVNVLNGGAFGRDLPYPPMYTKSYSFHNDEYILLIYKRDNYILDQIKMSLATLLRNSGLIDDKDSGFGLRFDHSYSKAKKASNDSSQVELGSNIFRSNYSLEGTHVHLLMDVERSIDSMVWSEMTPSVLLTVLITLIMMLSILFLQKIIVTREKLSEIKNDLISNITHEFKTPIATASAAVESMKSFDVLEDRQKTMSYLGTTYDQLQKLGNMVEKLLETATLDGGKIELQKERMDLSKMIESKVKLYAESNPAKNLSLDRLDQNVYGMVDPFHFENVLDNLIDNAIKYGGEAIAISLSGFADRVEILVRDSGATLTKSQSNLIFDKFYRVPKGNIHDVKGFGIGLYYSRQIIEKHGGNIEIELEKNTTAFKITLPNG